MPKRRIVSAVQRVVTTSQVEQRSVDRSCVEKAGPNSMLSERAWDSSVKAAEYADESQDSMP